MKKYLRTILILGLAVVLAACSTNATPTQAPTTDNVNVEPTLNAARTEAAATVEAAIANQPTETQPPATSTTAPVATAIPTATPVPQVATATSAPVQANTATQAPTATAKVVFVTTVPIEFGCTITASSITGDATKTSGADFDARWTIKNTGTSKWEIGTIDYKYNSGTKMYKSGDAYDLEKAVAAGDSIDIIVDMKAPTNPGNYQSNWAVVRGNTVLCTLPAFITVK